MASHVVWTLSSAPLVPVLIIFMIQFFVTFTRVMRGYMYIDVGFQSRTGIVTVIICQRNLQYLTLLFLYLICAVCLILMTSVILLILLFNVDLISSTSAVIVAGKVVDGLLVMRKIEVQVP